jgi:serine/threonine protein phosphatase 1
MIYAIGDIHGQKTMLDGALALIDRDGGSNAPVVFTGDYTDRGPDSRGVLDTLIGGVAAGRNWTVLRGNHDRMFTWYMDHVPREDPHLFLGLTWLNPRLGGNTTLASYGVAVAETRRIGDIHADARAAVPQAHIDFLASRPLTHRIDDLFFVHAGIRPGVPLPDQTEEDLIWIRYDFVDDTRDHGPLIVHGHTATDYPIHFGNRLNLDGGAGYGRPLIPVVFEDGKSWLLTKRGRVKTDAP